MKLRLTAAALLLLLLACSSTPPAAKLDSPVMDVDEQGEPQAKPPATVHPDAKSAEIAAELAELEVQTVGAIGGDASATPGLGDGEVPTGLLDDAPDAGSSGGGLVLGSGSAAPPDSSTGPKARVYVNDGRVTGDHIANAAAVLTRMRSRFRFCYEKLLESNPLARGSCKLSAKIGVNGEVLSVGSSCDPVLAAVSGCFKAVVAGGMFAPPQNSKHATITFSVHAVWD